MVDWDNAACRGQDTEVFFSFEDRRGEQRAAIVANARTFCNGCQIKNSCLGFAVESGQRFGIWGGLTPAERALLATRDLYAGTRADRAAS